MCGGGSEGPFCSSASPMRLLSFPALPEDTGGTGSAGRAHRKSAKKGSALALMGVGGHFLVLSYYYCLLRLNSTDSWALGRFSKTFVIIQGLLQQHF